MKLISQTEWAKKHSFSRQYASKLAKKGMIPTHNKQIIEDEADKILATMAKSQIIKEEVLENNIDLSERLLKAKVKSEEQKSTILEVKAKTDTGEYVRMDNIKKFISNKARICRDHFMNIPDRITPILASKTSEKEIYQILENELRQALETLTDGKH